MKNVSRLWLFILHFPFLILHLHGEAVRYVESLPDGNAPNGYVPALVSNGSLSFGVDWRLGTCDIAYRYFSTGIFREGVRHPEGTYELFDYGRFTTHIELDGVRHERPAVWRQSLDLESACVGVGSEYPGGIRFGGELFVYEGADVVAIRHSVTNCGDVARTVKLGIRYSPPDGKRVSDAGWRKLPGGAEYAFRAHLLQVSDERIELTGDSAAEFVQESDGVGVLAMSFTLAPHEARTCDWFMEYRKTANLSELAERAEIPHDLGPWNFQFLKARHSEAWRRYHGESYVHLPDVRVQRMFEMANYHLKCVATKWSIPVGVLTSHWCGKVFAFDELYACQALLAANHITTARCVPEYRFATLSNACNRAYQRFPLGKKWGARWPWQGVELLFMEGSKPGFWQDHIFHMSAITRSVWTYYRYTGDERMLREKIFPVIAACANFYRSLQVYTDGNGEMFIGKCTDLERMGPGVERAFMTTAGVIDTFRIAANAADIVGGQDGWAADLRKVAESLERGLPSKDGRYIAYPGAKVESIGTLAGYFPFKIFGEDSDLQKSALKWFLENGGAVGNMYAMGQQTCPWYAAWTAIAAQRGGLREEAFKRLVEADRSAGLWGEFHEINEPSRPLMHPWFMTAAANCLYAICEMLVSEGPDGKPVIGAGVPDGWRDYSFRLAFPGGKAIEAKVKDGKCEILPTDR